MLGKLRQKLFELHLQRLGNQSLSAFAQHYAQQIVPLWLAQWNYRILLHGWRDSLCGWLKNDLDNRIPAGHAAFFNSSPYTRIDHSSGYNVELLPQLLV